MKIISFDVGIKNLAYCILDDELYGEEDNKCIKYKIHDWDVIDLTDTKIVNFDDGVTDNKFLYSYKKLKVGELRSYLEKLERPSSGNRKDLIIEIERYLKEKNFH